jgi:hypothetical protein
VLATHLGHAEARRPRQIDIIFSRDGHTALVSSGEEDRVSDRRSTPFGRAPQSMTARVAV